MQTIVWLSPDVLGWRPYLAESALGDPAAVRRAYAHWEHATRVLSGATTAFHHVDVITTLKRALDHRIRLLNDNYRWSSLTSVQLPKGMLQKLEYLGVARHAMVKRLTDLRNEVEHADREPPPFLECADYVELTWYFLRARDILAIRVPEKLELEPADGEVNGYQLVVRSGPVVDWRVEIEGVLGAQHIAAFMHDDWTRVELTRYETRGEWLARGGRQPIAVVHHEALDPLDVFIKGTITGPTDHVLRLQRILLTPM